MSRAALYVLVSPREQRTDTDAGGLRRWADCLGQEVAKAPTGNLPGGPAWRSSPCRRHRGFQTRPHPRLRRMICRHSLSSAIFGAAT